MSRHKVECKCCHKMMIPRICKVRVNGDDVIKSICPFCHTEWDPKWLQFDEVNAEVMDKVIIWSRIRTGVHFACAAATFYSTANFGYEILPAAAGCWYIAKLLMDKFFPV